MLDTLKFTPIRVKNKLRLLLKISLYFFKYKLLSTPIKNFPFLCVITPIFDDALPSVKLLVKSLQLQTEKDFFHILISNGPSPKLKSFISKINKHDARFLYIQLKKNKTKNLLETVIDIGQRREFALKNFNAQRYIFLDADFKILSSDLISKLKNAHLHQQKDIILTKVVGQNKVLPIFPIKVARIDMANFSFSFWLAKTRSYPTNIMYNWEKIGIVNDYIFFDRIYNHKNAYFLPILSGVINGNQSYKSLTQRHEKRK